MKKSEIKQLIKETLNKTTTHFSGVSKLKKKIDKSKLDIIQKQWPNWSFNFKPYNQPGSDFEYIMSYDSNNTNETEIETVKKFMSLYLKNKF